MMFEPKMILQLAKLINFTLMRMITQAIVITVMEVSKTQSKFDFYTEKLWFLSVD